MDESLALALSRLFEDLRTLITIYNSLMVNSSTQISGTVYNYSNNAT